MAVVGLVEPQPRLHRHRPLASGARFTLGALLRRERAHRALDVALDDARPIGVAAVRDHLHLRMTGTVLTIEV